MSFEQPDNKSHRWGRIWTQSILAPGSALLLTSILFWINVFMNKCMNEWHNEVYSEKYYVILTTLNFKLFFISGKNLIEWPVLQKLCVLTYITLEKQTSEKILIAECLKGLWWENIISYRSTKLGCPGQSWGHGVGVRKSFNDEGISELKWDKQDDQGKKEGGTFWGSMVTKWIINSRTHLRNRKKKSTGTAYSVREIKQKIKSTKNGQQILKGLKNIKSLDFTLRIQKSVMNLMWDRSKKWYGQIYIRLLRLIYGESNGRCQGCGLS